MTLEQLNEKLLALEEKLDLFNQKINGVYFWERIRVDVQQKIIENKKIQGKAHTETKEKSALAFKVFIGALKNILVKNPYFAPKTDVLFWGHERRKLQNDGKYYDIYSDFLINKLEENKIKTILLESPYLGGHLSPAKTKNLYYFDFIEVFSTLKRRFGLAKINLSQKEKEIIEEARNKIKEELQVDIDLEKLVKKKLLSRKILIPKYKKILKKATPKAVIVLVGYGRENFIEACKDLKIPTIELQHGTIYRHHFGYSFPPPKRFKKTFSDYFFSFGNFWTDNLSLPIPKENIFPVGYPYFEKESKKYNKDKKNKIVFISQGTIGKNLSKFAVETEKKLKNQYQIIYKLHPGEYDRWRQEYPWLINSQVKVIDKESEPVYKTLSEAKIQIGVNSTLIYEGLGLGIKTYLLNVPGVEAMRNLTDKGFAHLVNSPEQFVEAINKTEEKKKFSEEEFFAKNSLEKMLLAIKKIAKII